MADTKISAMTSATEVKNTDVLPFVSGTTNFKCARSILNKGAAGEDLVFQSSAGQIAELVTDDGAQFVAVDDGVGVEIGGASFSFVCDPSSTTWQLLAGASGASIETANGQSTRFIMLGGGAGQLTLDYNTNTLSTQGWGQVTIQYTTSSTNWQTSDPADHGTAIDRLAAAVAGLLGGPVP